MIAKTIKTLRRIYRSKLPELILINILATIILFELSLQLLSITHNQIRRAANKNRANKNKDITVVCLGESTTQYQYPDQLGEILTTRLPEKKITVIDEGQAGANTDMLIAKLPGIQKYKPDIIVAMMGCQDKSPNFVRYGNISHPMDYWLTKHIKTYALIRYLYYEKNTPKTPQKNLPPIQITSKPIQLHPMHIKLAALAQQQENKNHALICLIKKHIENHKTAIEKQAWDTFFLSDGFILYANNASNPTFTQNLTQCLLELETLANPANKANLIEYVKQHVKTPNPTSNAFAFLLIQLYLDQTNYDSLYDVVGFLQLTYPKNLYLMFLKQLYGHDNNKTLSTLWLEQTGTILKNPEANYPFNPLNYSKLILLVLDIPKPILVEKYEQLIALFPQAEYLYPSLSWLYSQTNQMDKMAPLYNLWLQNVDDFFQTKARDVNFWVKALAATKQNPASRFPAYESKMLHKNYLQLARFCKDNNTVLVCMQYPLLDIEPLKELLKGFENVVFVSNVQPFATLVAENGFATYFVDNFGGCFGHATQEGNRLIAQNAAKAILKILS